MNKPDPIAIWAANVVQGREAERPPGTDLTALKCTSSDFAHRRDMLEAELRVISAGLNFLRSEIEKASTEAPQ